MFLETATVLGYYILWVDYHDGHMVLLVGWFIFFDCFLVNIVTFNCVAMYPPKTILQVVSLSLVITKY